MGPLEKGSAQNEGDFRAPREVVWSRRSIISGLAVILLTGVGALTGYSIGASAVSVETVIHSWQKSEAQLFYAGPYGDFSEESAIRAPIDMGSNRVRFPLETREQRESIVHRLDPCSCSGVAVGRIGLRSPFAYEPVTLDRWTPGGGAESFVLDSTMVSVISKPNTLDPQILFHLDIPSFVRQSATIGGFLGGAITLLALSGTLFVIQRLRLRFRAVLTPAGRRRLASHNLGPWVAGLALVVTGFGVGQAAAGAMATGVTIDEGYHVGHLQNYLEGGNYSSASYGPAAALVGHAVNIALGNEVFGTVSSDQAAFMGRHLGVALTGILAILAVGVATGVLLQSWSWGVVGAGVLASVPLWVGHSMFNIKDIPAGSGYALFSAGLVIAISQHLRPVYRLSLTPFFVIAGIALGIGTRPGMWPLFAASALVAVVVWSIGFFIKRSSLAVKARRYFAISFLSAVLVLSGAIVLGLFFTEVGRDLVEAVTLSLDYPWSKSRRFLGERVFNRPDAWLVFSVLMSQLPTAIGVVFVVGSLVSLWIFIASLIRGNSWSSLSNVFPLWAIPVFLPFIVVAIFSPVLYDGIRQILFILPGVAVFGTVGIWALVQLSLRVFESRKMAKTLSGVALGLVAVLIGVDQLRLYPYNYVYVNEIAQGTGVTGAWETDYWDASFREAIDGHVVEGDPIMCGHTHTLYVDIEELRPLCIAASPYVAALEPGVPSLLGEREFWTVRSEREFLESGPPPANCSPYSAVTRMLRFEPLVMSRLYVCQDY
jgi:hypothetical protein